MVCMLRVGADGWKLDGEELRECTSSLTDSNNNLGMVKIHEWSHYIQQSSYAVLNISARDGDQEIGT